MDQEERPPQLMVRPLCFGREGLPVSHTTMIGYKIYKTRSQGGPDKRGNNAARKRRKEWLLETFGDGKTCPCAFEDCDEVLTIDTVTADRWPISGKEGGSYRRENIRPACLGCNSSDGQRVKEIYVPEVFESGPQW